MTDDVIGWERKNRSAFEQKMTTLTTEQFVNALCKNENTDNKFVKHIQDIVCNENSATYQMQQLYSSFIELLEQKNFVVADLLLKYMPSMINYVPNNVLVTFTALHRACQAAQLDVVDFLVKRGADINIKTIGDVTPLIYAFCDFDIVQRLLAEPTIRVNAVDDYGNSALHRAARFAQPEIAQILLRAGAVVNQRNQFGKTPLWISIFEGGGTSNDLRTAQCLISEGGCDGRDGIHGETLLEHALENSNITAAAFLLQNGARFTKHAFLIAQLDEPAYAAMFARVSRSREFALMLTMCIALKNFDLPVLLVLNIIDQIYSPCASFGRAAKWQIARAVKQKNNFFF